MSETMFNKEDVANWRPKPAAVPNKSEGMFNPQEIADWQPTPEAIPEKKKGIKPPKVETVDAADIREAAAEDQPIQDTDAPDVVLAARAKNSIAGLRPAELRELAAYIEAQPRPRNGKRNEQDERLLSLAVERLKKIKEKMKPRGTHIEEGPMEMPRLEEVSAPLTATEIIIYLQNGAIKEIGKNEEAVLLGELERRYRDYQKAESKRGFLKRFFKSDEQKSYEALRLLIEKTKVAEEKLPSAE